VKYLALVAACLLAVGLASPATAGDTTDAAGATPTFTWPEVTSFNPGVYTYTVVVSGEGNYPYQLRAGDGWVQVPGPGAYDVPRGWAYDEVQAYHCGETTCDEVSASPPLTLVSSLRPSWDYEDQWFVAAPGASRTLRYALRPAVPGTTLRWLLAPAGRGIDGAVASGTVADAGATGTVTIQVPGDAPDATRYEVFLQATLDGERYGHLVGDSDPAVATTDDRAPQVRIKLEKDTIYPLAGLRDWGIGYEEWLRFQLGSSEDTHGTLTFTGPDGTVVDRRTVSLDAYSFPGSNTWVPIKHHEVYPEGSYELRLEVTDEVGHPASATATVYVSHARLRGHKETKIVPAARTLVDRAVGSCSSLTIPSSHHWKGSIGYASESRCDRAADGNVTTLHRVFLPDSFRHYYSLKVYYSGAAAQGRPGSRIAAGFVNRKGKVTVTNVSSPRAKWNVLPQENIAPYVRTDDRGRHYVLWAMGTGGGNQYDVRSFRYRIGYRTLS
jgi:hypothetical protein